MAFQSLGTVAARVVDKLEPRQQERKPEYRFKCQIVDETTGDVVEADWTSLTEIDRIDEFGNCEAVDSIVGRLLRIWNTKGRAEHEREEYAAPDEDEGDQ